MANGFKRPKRDPNKRIGPWQRLPSEITYCNKLEKLWRESPMYWEALRNAKIAVDEYRCAKCDYHFRLREVEVDHIEPKIAPETGWKDCSTFAARLNCPTSGLQVLCEDTCHKEKTAQENSKRSVFKRLNNSVNEEK